MTPALAAAGKNIKSAAGDGVPDGSRIAAGRIFGVCGYPLGQSLSPALHSWAFAHTGITASYTAWETPPESLPAFIAAFRAAPYGGASITIPHKRTVMPLLDGTTQTARRIGAVNTLFWENGRLLGHNTDLEGFLAPLVGLPAAPNALVLGAGGAARAIVAALAERGVARLLLAARRDGAAHDLARDAAPFFTTADAVPWDAREEALAAAAATGVWVVNTTPLGMLGAAESVSPISREAFAAVRDVRHCLAYDLVYNPLRTVFLAAAEEAGWPCRDGLGMFVAQAAAQFRLWTGRRMPAAQARAFLANRLAPPGPAP